MIRFIALLLSSSFIIINCKGSGFIEPKGSGSGEEQPSPANEESAPLPVTEESPGVDEPVSVAGAFLVSCGRTMHEQAKQPDIAVGCRSEPGEPTLQASELTAIVINGAQSQTLEAIVPTDQSDWQLVYIINAGSGDDAMFQLRPRSAENTSDPVFQAKISRFQTESLVLPVCPPDSAQCFTSLAAWQESFGNINFDNCPMGDLVCLKQSTVVRISGQWPNADANALTIDNWVSNEFYHIKIISSGRARHRGKLTEDIYRLSPQSGEHAITINQDYTIIDGLAIGGFVGDSVEGIRVNANEVILRNLIIYDLNDQHQDGIYVNQSGINLTVESSIFYNIGRSAVMLQGFPEAVRDTKINIRNVSAYNTCSNSICQTDLYAPRLGGIGFDRAYEYPGSVITFTNTFVHSATNPAFSLATTGSFAGSMANLANDDTAPGDGSVRNAVFTDAVSETQDSQASIVLESLATDSPMLLLKPIEANAAWRKGTDLSDLVRTDITDQKPERWSIGAHHP